MPISSSFLKKHLSTKQKRSCFIRESHGENYEDYNNNFSYVIHTFTNRVKKFLWLLLKAILWVFSKKKKEFNIVKKLPLIISGLFLTAIQNHFFIKDNLRMLNAKPLFLMDRLISLLLAFSLPFPCYRRFPCLATQAKKQAIGVEEANISFFCFSKATLALP